MDLWIRSQDKRTLGIAKDIHICERRVVVEYPELHSEKDPDNYVILIGGYEYGVYKTKERALEVLDEIQKTILEGEEDFKGMVVYEMPADDEAK